MSAFIGVTGASSVHTPSSKSLDADSGSVQEFAKNKEISQKSVVLQVTKLCDHGHGMGRLSQTALSGSCTQTGKPESSLKVRVMSHLEQTTNQTGGIRNRTKVNFLAWQDLQKAERKMEKTVAHHRGNVPARTFSSRPAASRRAGMGTPD
ncbi:MAG TPA: hypothetical protein VF748_04930 [Candidatus Acidoferrum sp.]